MKYLLDTNIIVHWLHGQRRIAESIDHVGLSRCCISEITKAELLFGEEKAASRGIKVNGEPLKHLFNTIESVPISDAIELYAAEKARLQSEGRPIEDFDLLIGCSAVIGGMVMVSDNAEHLGRISGIRIQNWASNQEK